MEFSNIRPRHRGVNMEKGFFGASLDMSRNAVMKPQEVVEYAQDAQLVQLATENNAFFEGTQFCQPVHRKDLKAFSTYYEDALTY